MNLRGKNVLIVGLARSGAAAASLLVSQGATATVNDIKRESEFDGAELQAVRDVGARLSLGGHPADLFANADLIVLSPGVPSDIPALAAARSAGVEVMSEVELASRFLRGRLIGVTGSNGKTTTTSLIGALMSAAGAETLVGGNIGTPLSSLVSKSTEESWTVAELSSFQLETIKSFRAHVAVVTNITPDHLDRHPSFQAYVAAKKRILENQTSSDWAVLNGADPSVANMIAVGGGGSKTIYFNSRTRKCITGAAADLYLEGGSLLTTLSSGPPTEREVIRVDEIPLRGMHNVENVMAAAGATICAIGADNCDFGALRKAIKQFKGVEHRIEYVADVGGVKFYNDSKATNVDSTLKALEAFDGNLVLILGGKDKGSDYGVLGPLIAQRVKQIVLIGAASEKISAQLSGVTPMTRAGSMEDAVQKSMSLSQPGDIVLLAPACASFDMFDNYEHRGRAFKQAVFALGRRDDVEQVERANNGVSG